MIQITPQMRVLVAVEPTDFRKGIDGLVRLCDAVRERLMTMTTDFQKLWTDPGTPNRERKRLLAHIIEDVTLITLPEEGITKIHVRFK